MKIRPAVLALIGLLAVFALLPAAAGPGNPPMLIIHGWQGVSPGGGYTCSGADPFDGTNSTLGDLPGMFADQYDVWIAHLDSSPKGTPSLAENADCLAEQVAVVNDASGQQVVLVGFSMGGLVSRACLSQIDCRARVSALYTLGTPHAGMNSLTGASLLLEIAEHILGVPLLGGICSWQTALCEMSSSNMVVFNTLTPNWPGVKYVFIGGDPTINLSPLKGFLELAEGRNDGLIGRYSAVGWAWPLSFMVPPLWDLLSPATKIHTDEVHLSAWGNAYSEDYLPDGKSQTYHCIQWQQGLGPDPGYCSSPSPDRVDSDRSDSLGLLQTTPMVSGSIAAGSVQSFAVEVDSALSSSFLLSWTVDPISLTLVRPDGQVIDPAYAAAHPDEVHYTASGPGADFPALASYTFPITRPGTWQVCVSSGNLGAPTSDYVSLTALVSTRTMSLALDRERYVPGETAKIEVTLRNLLAGIPGGTVRGVLNYPDGSEEQLVLVDQGDGRYLGEVTIPKLPGYVFATFTAQATDGTIRFSRQESVIFTIDGVGEVYLPLIRQE